jgi:hypothetical protein
MHVDKSTLDSSSDVLQCWPGLKSLGIDRLIVVTGSGSGRFPTAQIENFKFQLKKWKNSKTKFPLLQGAKI